LEENDDVGSIKNPPMPLESRLEAETRGDRVKLKKKGVIPLRYHMIAEFAANAYPPSLIAKEMRMPVKRIYQILATNTQVHEEIQAILDRRLAESERMIGHLFVKALTKLDVDMESSDKDQRNKAIDKVISIYRDAKGKGKEGGVNQFFDMGGGNVTTIQDIDALIIAKRRERGLEPPDEKEKK
jgi:hypothetical protein